MEMPLLGLGTWRMGGGFERDMRNASVEVESIRYALSTGYRLIDTAEAYGTGGSEEIVGKAIAETRREDLFIVSKVWREHLRYNDVLGAAERSLKRLNTSYLDLYLIHWPDPAVQISETLSAMNELKSKGIVRNIGVSNFDVPLLKEALATKIPIYANQIEYSIVNRAAEDDVIPFCAENNIRVMAYRPLGRGNLENAPPELAMISKKREATSAQIALSFITSQHITAIPKASRPEHLKENWESLNFPLSSEELRSLKRT